MIIEEIILTARRTRSESDEYAQIRNVSADPVQLGGWTLSAGHNQDFSFPTYRNLRRTDLPHLHKRGPTRKAAASPLAGTNPSGQIPVIAAHLYTPTETW